MRKISTFIIFFLLTTAIAFSQWFTVPSSPTGYIQNIVDVNNTIYLSHSSSGVFRSTDNMISWQMINNGLDNMQAKNVFEVLLYNGYLYAATVDGIYKSTDDGNNWVKKSNGITIGSGAAYEFTESIFEYNGSLFTGAFNGIYRSTDNAENWIMTNVTGEHIFARNFIEHNGILFAARESGNFPSGYKSFDGGITWESLPTSPLFATITFFSEQNKLWCGTIHGAWLSTDNGLNWEERSNGLNPDPYNSCFLRINGQLITTLKFGGSGVFRSSDDGLNWENFGDALPFLSLIEKIILYDDKIVAATSQGLWQRDTTEVITQIKVQENQSLREFELRQNFPNPFNPSTTIKYSIPNSNNVSLKVYDILGNEISTLVSEEKSAGVYEIKFDAANLPSGMYIYQLNAGSFIQTKKMLLLE